MIRELNIGQNIEHYILKAIRDYFGGSVKVHFSVSKGVFREKEKIR